jgi:argininosuccinate lyase
MTYNRDLQEDKERLFDTADTVRATTRLMAAMLRNTKINRAACEAAANDPALLATDLADYLVKKGMPFRQAHHVVGAVVANLEKHGDRMKRSDWGLFLVKHVADSNTASHASSRQNQSIAEIRANVKSQNKKIAEATEIFDLQRAMSKRNLIGAPGTKEVAKQLAHWRKQLS